MIKKPSYNDRDSLRSARAQVRIAGESLKAALLASPETSRTFRQKRPTWRMHSAQVRFRWQCIGRRFIRCLHLYNESRWMRREDMCVVGIDPAVEQKEALGNDGILGQDKISHHSKHLQPARIAKPHQLPLTNSFRRRKGGPRFFRLLKELGWRELRFWDNQHPRAHHYRSVIRSKARTRSAAKS